MASPILDQFGQPYSRPPKPIADVPAFVGLQRPAQQWSSFASCLSPERAARILRCAKLGDAEAYLTLAEELEERDLQYASLLQQRKLAVTGEEIEITPGDATPRAAKVAEAFCESIVEQDEFITCLFDLMDAVAKGYSVVQPHWDVSEGQVTITQYEWCDPRYFVFDRATLRELRLRSNFAEDGVRLPAGQFMAHYPRVKTGIRLRAGVAMLATIAHVSKSFTLSSWLAFAEVFGMPLRVAHYDPEVMGQAELDKLRIALANIGHDAAALIPNGSSIEILDGRRPTSGDNVFEGLADYWDKQLSKAIVGQTMTTDDGSSKSQAEVHDKVRLDIRRADAKAICATIRKGVIEPWVRFNYGPHVALPKMKIAVDPPEDLEAFSRAVVPFIEKAGLKVRASEVREKFGLSDPAEGEDDDVLGAVQPAGAGDNEEPDANDPAPQQRRTRQAVRPVRFRARA